MVTDAAGVGRLVSKLFFAVHRSSTYSQSRLKSLVRRFYWSNVSSGGNDHGGLMDDSSPRRKDVLRRLCEKNFDLDRKDGAGGPTTTRDHYLRSTYCACSSAVRVSTRSVYSRELGADSEQSQKKVAGDIFTSSVVFSDALRASVPVGSEIAWFRFINGVDDTHMANPSDGLHICIFPL